MGVAVVRGPRAPRFCNQCLRAEFRVFMMFCCTRVVGMAADRCFLFMAPSLSAVSSALAFRSLLFIYFPFQVVPFFQRVGIFRQMIDAEREEHQGSLAFARVSFFHSGVVVVLCFKRFAHPVYR